MPAPTPSSTAVTCRSPLSPREIGAVQEPVGMLLANKRSKAIFARVLPKAATGNAIRFRWSGSVSRSVPIRCQMSRRLSRLQIKATDAT